MKITRTILNTLVACGVALAMVSTVVAQAAGDGSATVVRIKGAAAQYRVGNNPWQRVSVGTVLHPGTLLQTSMEKGGYVDLVIGGGGDASIGAQPVVVNPSLPNTMGSAAVSYQPRGDQNTIRVFENTVLAIDKLASMNTGADVVSDTQLDLRAGRILGNVKKLSPASKYEIKLPNGVAGIRGTVYDISADGVVRVFIGSVVMAHVGAGGNVQTQVVSAGQQYDARSGAVTPMPSSSLKEMRDASNDLRVQIRAEQEATFTVDSTIYRVSPKGKAKGQDKGKGQGQGNQ